MSLATREWVVGAIFLFQSVLGILGNVLLLSRYVCLNFTGCKLRPTDVIVKNLTVANLLVLLAAGIRDASESFGWHQVSDLNCKLFPCIRRVGRGMTISTTCLLSILQAVTISPKRIRWAELKAKAPKCVVPLLVFCWTVNLLMNLIFSTFLTSTLKRKNSSSRRSFGHCASIHYNGTRDSLFSALFFFTDSVCLGLMLWANGSMVYILCRHKQRVRYLYRNSLSSRSSHESSATQTIFLLASTFLCFYVLPLVLHNLWVLFNHINWFFLNITKVFSLCFPTVTPYLLLYRDASLFRFCSSFMRNIKSPIPM